MLNGNRTRDRWQVHNTNPWQCRAWVCIGDDGRLLAVHELCHGDLPRPVGSAQGAIQLESRVPSYNAHYVLEPSIPRSVADGGGTKQLAYIRAQNPPSDSPV